MQRIVKFIQPMFAAICLLLVTQSAFAISIGQAKAQGYIGERSNGYLGIVVSSPPSDVPSLVNNVNSRRRVEYQRIASQRGVDLSQVERLAGQEAINKTPSGQYVEINGQWVRK